MAWEPLPTNYTNASWTGLKRYSQINNEDGTVSFQDVTVYSGKENSFFGATDANRMNGALNTIMATLEGAEAGTHNSIYRGKHLGSSVTSDQYSFITAGTFDDMYIGDYWAIGGTNYRIAAFDYYYLTGDTPCNQHHITLVPDEPLYNGAMNSSDTSNGAYIGSAMYKSGLTQAKSTINSAFGSSHILSHRQYLQNAVSGNYSSGGGWYSSSVEIMTEQNVYGCKIYGNVACGTNIPNNMTIDKTQFPLFAFRPDLISNGAQYWLRDVASSSSFAYVNEAGVAYYRGATNSFGVRPSFSIY